MRKNTANENPKLDQLGASIVYMMGNVGLYHYNKLAYLFEYFYIKNFGEKFTKEEFTKLKHGPVISGYKYHIKKLAMRGVYDTDIEKLMEKRKVDAKEDLVRIEILPTENTVNNILDNPLAILLLDKIINKYGHLSTVELEKLVYKTQPVRNLLENRFIFKKNGHAVLTGNLGIRETKKNIPESKRIYLEHIKKYPTINFEQQKLDAEEFAFLEKLRPSYE